MKVSDPIIFGHCVKVFFKDVFAKHGDLFAELKVNVNNGLGDIYDKIKGHPKQAEVEADIMKQYETRLKGGVGGLSPSQLLSPQLSSFPGNAVASVAFTLFSSSEA